MLTELLDSSGLCLSRAEISKIPQDSAETERLSDLASLACSLNDNNRVTLNPLAWRVTLDHDDDQPRDASAIVYHKHNNGNNIRPLAVMLWPMANVICSRNSHK